MTFSITILGSSSAIPTKERHTTSQFLQIQNHRLLMDCGEGAIHRMIELSIPLDKIDTILISHLHTDHILGLPGLLSTYVLKSRIKPLTIFSPEGLQEIIEPLTGKTEDFPFPLSWKIVNTETSSQILESETFTITSIPLSHRVPTSGYLFKEKVKPPNIKKEAIKKYGLTVEQIKALKNDQNVKLPNGEILPATEATLPPPSPRAFAFCSDTMFEPKIVPIIRGVNILYHEATYLNEHQHLAEARGHSTAADAAKIARQANVGQLLLGHFSSRYKNVSDFEKEASSIFPNTHVVMDGESFEL